MNTYFHIKYEFDKESVHNAISERLQKPGGDYICVSDGVIMNVANRFPEYLKVINGGMFSICDSSFVPLYLKKLYGLGYEQYCGTSILRDIVEGKKYRMLFLGANQKILDDLKESLLEINPDVAYMKFMELPYCKVSKFDYPGIAKEINADNPDIIFISLGAPKQEFFMSFLQPHLNRGVMIAVGAAFNFIAGKEKKRAPQWMIDHHLEFVYRLKQEPVKQSKRCFHILRTLPGLLYNEWRESRKTNYSEGSNDKEKSEDREYSLD